MSDHSLNPNIGLNKGLSYDIITEGVVTFVDDFYKNGTIRVRPNQTNIEVDIFPLIPIYNMILPKVGDSVNLIPKKSGTTYSFLWVGPINVDYKKLNSSSKVGDGVYVHGKPITKYPDAKGIYPNLDEITINGRWNSDLRLGKNQTLLRAGQHNIDSNEVYNQLNQGYVLMKLSPLEGNKTRETTNIVGEYINLLSPKGTPNFTLYDRGDSPLTEEVIDKILNDAHPAVFGDKLIELLKLIIKSQLTHSHNWFNMSTNQFETEKKLAKFDLTTIVSKYVKLN